MMSVGEIRSKLDLDGVRGGPVLPLTLADKPKAVSFWTSGQCNLRCSYCLHGLESTNPKRAALSNSFMTWETYEHIIEGLGEFDGGIEAASFCGVGEPTMHPRLPDMIRLARESGAARFVEVTTNGLLLDHALSQQLVEAGCGLIVVSVQGTSPDAYRRICGASPDMERFLERLKWLFDHRNGCRVHVKAMDVALDGGADEQKFYEMFGPVCDTMYVEHAVPLFQEVDYGALVDEVVGQFDGAAFDERAVGYCSLLFTTMHFLPDGSISPCPLTTRPALLGKVGGMTPLEAWHSRKRLELLLQHAREQRFSLDACATCVEPCMLSRPGDIGKGELARIAHAIEERLDRIDALEGGGCFGV